MSPTPGLPRLDRSTFEELLRRAYEEALFLHPSPELAWRIARSALFALGPDLERQRKRRAWSVRSARRKGLGTLTFLLQQAVRRGSEPYERRQEEAGSGEGLPAFLLARRFVKTVLHVSAEGGPFAVAVGVCRILHDYSTRETLDIYQLLNPDHAVDLRAHDCRRFRRRLVERLAERFGDRIRLRRGQRREVQIVRASDSAESGRLADVLRDALARLAPWDARCLVPRDLAVGRALPGLHPESWPEEADGRAEVARVFALVSPPCFARLPRALDLDPPRARLAVPRFFLADGSEPPMTPPVDDAVPSGGSGGSSSLPGGKVRELWEDLYAMSRRRRGIPRQLEIRLDGGGVRRVDLTTAGASGRVAVGYGPDAGTWLEIRGRYADGWAPLACCVLRRDDRGRLTDAVPSVIRRERGQELRLHVASHGELKIDYRERRPWRAAQLAARHLGAGGARNLRPRPAALRTAIAAVLVVAALGWALAERTARLRLAEGREPPGVALDPPVVGVPSATVFLDGRTRREAGEPVPLRLAAGEPIAVVEIVLPLGVERCYRVTLEHRGLLLLDGRVEPVDGGRILVAVPVRELEVGIHRLAAWAGCEADASSLGTREIEVLR